MNLTTEVFTGWLERYFRAWQTNDPKEVSALFSEPAVYYYGPFSPPATGRAEIVERWVADPEQQEDIRCSYEPIAVSEDVGVAHWNVSFRPAKDRSIRIELDGILVIRFDERIRCLEHREWYVRRETPVTPAS